MSHAGIFDDLKKSVSDLLDTSKTNLANYAKTEDKTLVDTFYAISADGKVHGIVKELMAERPYKFIALSRDNLGFSDLYLKSYMQGIERTMAAYAYDPLDAIGTRYVAMANARGNVVKQYKPVLTGMINSMLVQNLRHEPAPNVRTWLAKDNALMEYTPSGELISIMTRSHRAIDIMGATSEMYINFYFGKDLMRLVENRISNSVFTENFQRVAVIDGPKPKGPDAPGQVAQASEQVAVAAEGPTSSVPLVAATQPVAVTPASAPVATTTTPAPRPVAPPVVAAEKPALTAEQRIKLLQQLAEMRKSGVLTAEEFNQEKSKLLTQ